MTAPPPPGWYPDSSGTTRWWNGAGWVDPPATTKPSSPWWQNKWTIIGAVVVVLAVIGAIAGTSDKSKKPAGPVATVGAPTLSVSGSSGAASGSTITVQLDAASADITVSDFKEAKPGGLADIHGTLYVATVTAVGKVGQFDINPLFFNARAESGLVIDVTLAATGDQIDSTTVNPGDKVVGTVGFDVPAGETVDLVQMKTVFGRLLGSWQI